KGATRAFPDQPVIIPGSMATGSYILEGQESSMTQTFGSTCHGAGRRMSRTQAKKQTSGDQVRQKMEDMGIVVNAGSMRSLAEESPQAYKDVDQVVDVVENVGEGYSSVGLHNLEMVKTPVLCSLDPEEVFVANSDLEIVETDENGRSIWKTAGPYRHPRFKNMLEKEQA
ncbi:RtcB family protein, partial [Patescibacteria group bacterium]